MSLDSKPVRLHIELGEDRRDVKVTDEAGNVVMQVEKGALTCWNADAPAGSRQRELLEYLGQAAVYHEHDENALQQDYPMPLKRRRKLWEMRPTYHCQVIGTCATLQELRKVARQSHMESQVRLNDYEVHSSFVAIACERAPASKRLNKLLDQKFQQVIRRFASCKDEAALRQQWLGARSAADIAGALWAIMTHPATTMELAQQVYQEVHMLAHAATAQNRSESSRVPELQRENRRLERELQRQASKYAESLAGKNRHIERLTTRLARARDAEQRLARLESGETLQQLEQRVAQLSRQLGHAERRAEQAQLKRQTPAATPQAASHTVPSAISTDDGCNQCEQGSDCARINLGGRCILCVGGLTGLTDRYREMVEGYNGRFLHHDGGKENSNQQLTPLLQRADAIVCPIDCVSHDAARRVKRYCKRYGKAFIFVRSSSCSAFAGALDKLSC